MYIVGEPQDASERMQEKILQHIVGGSQPAADAPPGRPVITLTPSFPFISYPFPLKVLIFHYLYKFLILKLEMFF